MPRAARRAAPARRDVNARRIAAANARPRAASLTRSDGSNRMRAMSLRSRVLPHAGARFRRASRRASRRFGSLLGSAAATVLLLGALATAHAEQPTIYKWIDENGVAHYTTDRDRIPKAIRDRVERAAPREPEVAAEPHREDVMRDAIRTAPAPAPAPRTAPVVREPVVEESVAEESAPIAPPAPVAAVPTTPEPAREVEPIEEFEDVAAPLESDVLPEPDPVSAPPPAPVVPLEPKQAAELAKLDGAIEELESEIAQREERLAALISTADEQRTTPLVDDPAFREISQKLPKLQSELQALRERRNKIQPATATP
ncbi:MAG: hypothetical protein DCC71_25285 [Proteobacteria bacterium]|nr:MAG: hypothetical protein DCC71_25285 [Pseudomonadota bacterium]